MSRLDGRSLGEFKKHMKFTTEIESRLMGLWAESPSARCDWYVDNGIDNGGEYVPDGIDTSDVDFVASVAGEIKQLEMKFVPTAGKLSLKSVDVANYIRKGADILFIFYIGEGTLKVPKVKCIETHWGKIMDAHDTGHLRWSIMKNERIHDVRRNEDRISIPYMGGKPGYIIDQASYKNYMRIRRFWNEE